MRKLSWVIAGLIVVPLGLATAAPASAGKFVPISGRGPIPAHC